MGNLQSDRIPFGLWSPNRESASVLAWKSMLRFRSESWQWTENAATASWWIVDAQSFEVTPEMTSTLRHHPELRGIMLARQFHHLPDPIWRFFKTPLQAPVINNWLDQLLHRTNNSLNNQPQNHSLPLDWSSHFIRLHHWPNLTRYGDSGLALTDLCAKMLSDGILGYDYQKILISETLRAQFLHDAQEEGNLTWNTHPTIAIDIKKESVTQPNKSLLKRLWERFL